MGVLSTTLKEDATSIAATGGTDLLYTSDGVEIPNGVHLAAKSVADYTVRPSITFKTRNPQLVNGVYTKGKRWMTFTQPKVKADGTVAFNVCRIELEVHPESSAAEALDVAYQAAQLLFDSDTADFVATGAID